jgi:hypothetical protein
MEQWISKEMKANNKLSINGPSIISFSMEGILSSSFVDA